MWEPTRRIRNARQKLDGLSPVALLVNDLKQMDGLTTTPRGGATPLPRRAQPLLLLFS